MPKNMILRLGVDASDFHKKMAQAGASSESAGKRIKKNLTMSDIGGDVSKIMGWSGSATGLGRVNAGNADLALSHFCHPGTAGNFSLLSGYVGGCWL